MKSGGWKAMSESRRAALVGLGLAAVTLAAYGGVWRFDFTNYDDDSMVQGNPVVCAGLTGRGVAWALSTSYFEYWHPVTWLSHMLDCELFGLRAGGHHLVSLGLHIASTLLFFGVLRRMTGALWRSAMVAALFALHPLHVESVAWIAERKDVLSGFFCMLTLWAYCRYAERAGKGLVITDHRLLYYALALCCFALGLMSKPMLMTLPFVLLLLDYWPLRRNAEGRRQNDEVSQPPAAAGPSPVHPAFSILHPLLLEKLPFFALTAASCAITYAWARSSENLLSADKEPWGLRLANVPISYARYLGKLLWPTGLAVPYPMPTHWAWWQTGGAVLVLALMTLFAVRRARSAPYLIVGWLIFLGVLFPTIRLVQSGFQSIADRYTYIPSIGIFIAVVWAIADWGERRGGVGVPPAAAWRKGRPASRRAAGPVTVDSRPSGRVAWLTAAAAAALLLCGYLTRVQAATWRNSLTLWTHSLAVCPDNGVAHCNLGNHFLHRGILDEAAKQYREAIRIEPAAAFPYNGLGTADAMQAKLDDAIAMFLKAIALKPGLEAAHYNLGSAYLIQGKLAEAIAELKAALRLDENNIDAKKKLADALLKMNRDAEALPYCEAIVKAEPRDAQIWFMLGSAYLAARQWEPAAASFQEALRLAPDVPACMNALAWIYAASPRPQLRNGAKAVRLAEAACKLTRREQTAFLDTLAAAYAEAGRFEAALKTTEELRAVAAAAHDTNMVEMAQQRLDLYKAGKPCRDE